MLIEEKKKTINIHRTTLIVCFVCVIGLSVSATYLAVRAKYQGQLDNKNQEVLNVQQNSQALADQNAELMNSLQKLEDKYSKLDAKLSQLETQNADREAVEQKDNGPKEEILVLKPTWVGFGQTTTAFDGNLRIVLYASDKDTCQKDSAAVSYLDGDTDKKKLCLRTGRPEDFTYQGKNYLLNLSGIVATGGVARYCISISEAPNQ